MDIQITGTLNIIIDTKYGKLELNQPLSIKEYQDKGLNIINQWILVYMNNYPEVRKLPTKELKILLGNLRNELQMKLDKIMKYNSVTY